MDRTAAGGRELASRLTTLLGSPLCLCLRPLACTLGPAFFPRRPCIWPPTSQQAVVVVVTSLLRTLRPGFLSPQIMQLATYLTYFAPQISPRMWTLFPRMLQASGVCGLPSACALCACKHCLQACCAATAVAALAERAWAGAAGWGVPCAGRSLPAHVA